MGEAVDQPTTFDFSIVVAVHNVDRYLDEFIESLESQAFPRDRFEVIAVDHGSTDGSLAILRAWEDRRRGLVTVVVTDAGDRATARNIGLEAASGRWVTFPDPDDRLARDTLLEVAAFLDGNPTASLVATNRLILDGQTGSLANTHPLRRNFRQGNRLRDLHHYPDHIHDSAADAFFSRAILERTSLRFDPRAGAGFGDSHFCARYLLGLDRPVIGFAPAARYHFRKRPEFSPLNPQVTVAEPQRYVEVLRHGFLDLLRKGAEASADGRAPEWLQNLVLYELSWYITPRDADAGAVTEATERVSDEIHALLREILGHLDEDLIVGFSIRRVASAWTDFILRAYRSEAWHQEVAHVSRQDPDQGLVRLTYRFTGEPPQEQALSGGEVVEPAHAKVRDIAYQGRVMMRQRVLWLSSRQSVRLRLDGRDMDLQFLEPRPNHTLRPGQIKTELDPKRVAAAARGPRRRALGDRLLAWFARSRPVRRYFRDAWVLMDRVTDAGDNAERLFEYLRQSRRGINAWFVVEGDSPDWRRLRAAGHRRVVPYGSLRWKVLMANCRHLISSHVGNPVMRPPELLSFMEPTWRFTFLQHGVIHSNLARWFNLKRIDLFVTSSSQEYASIAGDHTPYSFTTKEVKLTGLPRWDRLRAMDAQLAPEDRDLILVAPTWRSGLVPLLLPRSQRRAIDPAFFSSEYAQSWMAILKSPELADACQQAGLSIGFLPHPNVQPALPGMQLPPHVRPLTFEDNDVQELFARSAVFVTDYSSMAFDAAYIDRPVVYFQFDREVFLGGAHHGRRGYFEFERDGFGPVTATATEAIRAIVDTIAAGTLPTPTYRARIEATFPLRDGECCKRVVDEIKRSTRRLSAAAAAVPTPTPVLRNRPDVG